MDAMTTMFIYILFIATPVTKASSPISFFWKPRLGLNLDMKSTTPIIQSGKVVMTHGYNIGVTLLSLVEIIESIEPYPQLSPSSANFYTNAYRWALRHFSLIPGWMSGQGDHYINTHGVWRKRFHYMDAFMPKWMRKLLFFVDEDEWKKEEREWKKFEKHSESAFGKFNKYPRKKPTHKFSSMRFNETLELNISNDSAAQ